jgi:hypothetical protein
VIFLYFYASWCPICNEERPTIFSAFDGLDDPETVGFEVHFNDDQTNSEDEQLARQFGITYQHTTVIIGSDGSESFRSLTPIEEGTILSEIKKAGE